MIYDLKRLKWTFIDAKMRFLDNRIALEKTELLMELAYFHQLMVTFNNNYFQHKLKYSEASSIIKDKYAILLEKYITRPSVDELEVQNIFDEIELKYLYDLGFQLVNEVGKTVIPVVNKINDLFIPEYCEFITGNVYDETTALTVGDTVEFVPENWILKKEDIKKGKVLSGINTNIKKINLRCNDILVELDDGTIELWLKNEYKKVKDY